MQLNIYLFNFINRIYNLKMHAQDVISLQADEGGSVTKLWLQCL